MGIELVTGFTGKAHISSLDVAKFNAGALGPGEYVFAGVKDDKLKATMASSNKVHISSGNAMMQGRHFWVDAAGVDLTVQTGTQSQKRNDLVVARYAKNASTGVESVSLVVIKGTPTTGTPADPSYTRGDILNGNALTNDMPLWRIPLNGITVGTPVQLFQEFTSAKDAWNSVSQAAVGNWATLQTYGKIAVLDVELIITGTMQPWQTLENSELPTGIAAAKTAFGVVAVESYGEATLDVVVEGSRAFLRNRGASAITMSQKGAYAHGQAVFFLA